MIGKTRGSHVHCSCPHAGPWYNDVVTVTTWINQNWFPIIQTAILAGGLFFTGTAILLDARARRAANLIQLTQQHRDLWERMYLQPELSRILDRKSVV